MWSRLHLFITSQHGRLTFWIYIIDRNIEGLTISVKCFITARVERLLAYYFTPKAGCCVSGDVVEVRGLGLCLAHPPRLCMKIVTVSWFPLKIALQALIGMCLNLQIRPTQLRGGFMHELRDMFNCKRLDRIARIKAIVLFMIAFPFLLRGSPPWFYLQGHYTLTN